MPRRCGAIFCPNVLTQPGQLHFSNYLIFAKPMRCFVQKRKRGRGLVLEEWREAGRRRGNETRRARPTVDNKRASVPAPASRGWGGLTGKALARARPSTQHQTGSTLTALGRKQHAAAAPSRHRGQD